MKISAKFRMKNGVPFSIEKLSGTQFRCGVCGKLFFDRESLDFHLEREKYDYKMELAFPKITGNISVKVIYTQDVRDRTNPKYPVLHKGDKLLNIDKLNSNEK